MVGGRTASDGRPAPVATLDHVRLRAEILRSAEALDPEADTVGPWRALAVATGNAFLTPEWFAAWRRHYDPKDRARVVVVRDRDPDDGDDPDPTPAGAIVGVLPVEIAGRTIRFAGANVGERYFPAARVDLRGEVAAAAATVLADAVPGAHLVLHHVPQASAESGSGSELGSESGSGSELGSPSDEASWVEDLRTAWPRRLTRIALRSDVLPWVSLPATWDEFLAARSRNFRNQIGRKERNLVKQHGARFRTADGSVPIATEMKQFFDLHVAQWEGRKPGTTLQSPDAQQFHVDFAAAALEQGWLRLVFLEADGRDVAALYGFTMGGRACYFNAGWDPAWSSTSVGLVLLAHAVRTACAEGASVYDFLLGDEEYKYRFATAEETVDTVALATPTSPARPALQLEGALRRVAAAVSEERKAILRSAVRPVMSRLPGGRRR